MTSISFYEIKINAHVVSAEANNTSVTLLLESFEEVVFNNMFLITIVVHSNEGMVSQPTSKRFGMNIQSYAITYIYYGDVILQYAICYITINTACT